MEFLDRNSDKKDASAEKGLGWFSAHSQERLHYDLDQNISSLGRQQYDSQGYGDLLKRAIVAYNIGVVQIDIPRHKIFE